MEIKDSFQHCVEKIFEHKLKLTLPAIPIALFVIHKVLSRCWIAYSKHLSDLKRCIFPILPSWLQESYRIQKMRKNLEKAYLEHAGDANQDVYLQHCLIVSEPLTYQIAMQEQMGSAPREELQDGMFHVQSETDIFAGVFDGHGKRSALLVTKVREFFLHKFGKFIEDKRRMTPGQMHKYLYTLFNDIQSQIHADATYNDMGTTAVICYINRQTNEIITATVGDAEANIYRTEAALKKSIPLSCVRNFGSPKDALLWERNRKSALDAGYLVTDRNSFLTGKHRYFYVLSSTGMHGVNNSRSIGDKSLLKDSWGNLGVKCKPKITLASLQKNDIVIVTSDGLKDHLDEIRIVGMMTTRQRTANIDVLPQDLIGARRPVSTYLDDVAVVAIQCR